MEGHEHMGQEAMDVPSHGPMCKMNMLFTWNTSNLCIIFRQWHVSSTFDIIISLLGVVILTAGYEFVRESSRRYEVYSAEHVNKLPIDNNGEQHSLLWPGRSRVNTEVKVKLIKAAFYALQVFYSFFIMLLFMTYNGWVMFAVAVGAFVGYLLFGNTSATKSVACH